MTHDRLDRLGSKLGAELRTAAGARPPLALLRRRHRQRVATRALVAVLAVVVFVLALPSVLPGPGVTNDPIAPLPSDTPTAPVELGAPVRKKLDLPDPLPLRLLAVRFNDRSLALIDLEAGEVRLHAPGQHGLPTQDAIGGAQLLSDGSAVVWQHDTVTVLPPDLGAPTLVHRPETMVDPPWAAPAFRVVPTVDEDALWVAQIGTGCCGEDIAGLVELVDLASGQLMMATEVPPDTFPVAALDGGLVMSTTAGWIETGDGWVDDPAQRETLVVADDGSTTTISPGWAIGASGSVVVVRSCETATGGTDCAGDLEFLDHSTGESRVMPSVDGAWTGVNGAGAPGDHAPWPAAAPDGRILLGLVERGDDPYVYHLDLVVIDPATLTTTSVGRVNGTAILSAGWDRQGRHVVVSTDRDLILIDVEAGTSVTLDNVIPEEHWVIALR